MSTSLRLLKPIATLIFVASSMLTINVQANENTEIISVVKEETGKKHHKGSSFKKYIKRLDLTEEQKLQVADIQTKTKAEFDLYKNDMKAYKDSKKLILQSDELDEASLSDLYSQYQTTFTAIELAKTKRMFEIKKVLTEEQFAKLKKMLKKKGKKGNKGKDKKAEK